MRKCDVSLEQPSDSKSYCGLIYCRRILQDCAYHKYISSDCSQNFLTESPQKVSSEPIETLLRVFAVCLEIQSDFKNYFGFVVDKFSEHGQVLDSWVIKLSSRQMPSSQKARREHDS